MVPTVFRTLRCNRHSVRRVCQGKHKVEYAQRSHTHRYVVLVFVCRPFIFHFTKVQTFSLFVLRRVRVFSIGFLNMCSLYNSCRIAGFSRTLGFCSPQCVSIVDDFAGFLQHSEFQRIAFQKDCIARRMKTVQRCQNFAECLPIFDPIFSGFFPKMQQLSRAFTELSRSLYAALRTIPDRYQLLRTLHAPRCCPF